MEDKGKENRKNAVEDGMEAKGNEEVSGENCKSYKNELFTLGRLCVNTIKNKLIPGSKVKNQPDYQETEKNSWNWFENSESEGFQECDEKFENHQSLVPDRNKENFESNLKSSSLIKIPVRKYNPADTTRKLKENSENLQEFSSLAPEIQQIPQRSSKVPKEFQKNLEKDQVIPIKIQEILGHIFKSPSGFQDPVKIPNKDSKEISEKIGSYRNLLYKNTKKQLNLLIKNTKSELASLNSLENLMLNKLSLNPSIDVTKDSETSEPARPPFLFNFNKSDGYITKDFTFAQHIVIPNSHGSSFMVSQNNSIIMVCTKTSELVEINLSSSKKTKLADLPTLKKFCALSYIDDSIALIGGNTNGFSTITDSVEVLNKSNQWENIAKLNWPRSHCQAVQHKAKTYVFAGYPLEIMSYIERYSNGSWEVLKFRLNENFACFGLTSYKDEILLIGGIKKETGKYRSIFGRIDPDKDSEFNEKTVDLVFVSNCVGSSAVVDGKLFFIDCIRGKVGSICID